MAKPKIQLPSNATDLILEILSLMGLVLLFFIPFQYYDQLADVVPAHFGIDGKPDAWGGKNNIWILPGIGLFVYVILTLVNRYPEKANYLVKITPENAERQYLNITRLNRRLKLLIIGFLAYFLFGTVQIALGEKDALNSLLIYAFVAAILFSVGMTFYRSIQLEK